MSAERGVYTDDVGIDSTTGRPVHSSMYRHLHVNLPKEVCMNPSVDKLIIFHYYDRPCFCMEDHCIVCLNALFFPKSPSEVQKFLRILEKKFRRIYGDVKSIWTWKIEELLAYGPDQVIKDG